MDRVVNWEYGVLIIVNFGEIYVVLIIIEDIVLDNKGVIILYLWERVLEFWRFDCFC